MTISYGPTCYLFYVQDSTDGKDVDALVHPSFHVPISDFQFENTSSQWTIKCWPSVTGKRMRLLVHLAWVKAGKLHFSVAVKLLGSTELVAKVTDRCRAGYDVLDVKVPHKILTSSAAKLMPGKENGRRVFRKVVHLFTEYLPPAPCIPPP
jgi:hypothetical protein